METHPYSIRLDSVLHERIQAIAETTGRTKTSFIREAIENYIEDMEDYADAVAALKDPRPSISLDEISVKYGLNDDVDG